MWRILEDLQQVVAGMRVERLEAPVFEDQELRRGQAAQQPAVPSVGPGQCQVGQQLVVRRRTCG